MPTTTAVSLAPSAFTPPSDPADLHGWLVTHEDRLAASARRALRLALGRAVDRWLASVTAAGDAGALGSVAKDWGGYVDDTLAKQLGGLYLGAAGSAVVKGAPDPAVFAPVINDRAVKYMSQATNRLKAVGDDAWGRLRGKLTEGMEKSWDLDRVNRELRQQVDMSEWRAETIARTETIGAYNNGNRLGGEALGGLGPAEHSWLATTDTRTRESHIIANGQCVPFDEPFDVGGVPMMHPSDPTAPPGEVINCRCVEQQLYPGDTRPDGTVIEAPEPPPAWLPPDFAVDNGIDPAYLTVDPHQPALGGGHEKVVLTDGAGNRYLFKPQPGWVAHGEVVGNDIARRAGLDTPQVWQVQYNGRDGSIQKLLSGARNGFPGGPWNPELVAVEDLDIIQQNRIVDWLIDNHDAHAGQWIREGYANQGKRVIGIDKGQAFKYWGESKLDYAYLPNAAYGEQAPVYNILERAWAEGEDVKFRTITRTVKGKMGETLDALQGIGDDELRAMLRPYAEGRFGAGAEADRFIREVIDRKNNLRSDFSKYHDRLYRQRQKALSALKPKPVEGFDGLAGGPRGMTGAVRSTPDTPFFAKHDTPAPRGPESDPIRAYTGNSYLSINSELRKGGTHRLVAGIDSVMGPAKSDFTVTRRVSGYSWAPEGDPSELVGTVVQDRGYLSTSARTDAWSGDVVLNVKVNQGTRGSWVGHISNHKSEKEYVLGRNQPLYIHAVTKTGSTFYVDAETVTPEWVRSVQHKVWDSNAKKYVTGL